MCVTQPNAEKRSRAAPSNIIVATYNVNGVNGRLPRLLEWLRETSPDVVCLQELKTDDTKFPAQAIAEAGYGAIWHGQRSHHGVAILARGRAPVEVRRGLPGDEDPQDRVVTRCARQLVQQLDGSGIGEGSGGGTGGGPYRPGSGIVAPRLLKEVKAAYTEEARLRNLEGDVVLEIVVRRDGSVGDVNLVKGLPNGLNDRAIAAVRQWRFAPATRLGQPVDVLVEVAVEFKLR